MAREWKEIPQEFPTDGAEVWVRRMDFWEGFLATWDATAGTFTIDNGLTMPWYSVSRWKAQ